ncbi:hypothetical protein MY838_06615 [Haemophilus influenzae]|uniref:Uncharacterized protein n=2 Tax=Haemophilus influenzae TaxID=727 RepID=A0A2S9S4S5_HAEIF|nr:hypothetical protein [Haemophilus influenzae]AXP40026.1 hypothetical protein CH628_07040 [Haemophilus influenzae]MCK8797621.1 hypothetical protein [Haemophilus influenzae]MCK8853397.1 hypothetical protein [Haemophilus influenzae]MCK8904929.1 hypothetical protein [Haemophilus influenzae]MCK8910748.1 hypothetical protein [Haemophilus influenzae]
MIAILSLFILFVGLLGLAIGFGVIALPWLVSGIIAAPVLFLYMLMMGSVLWLAEINFFLGVAALAVYCYWIHIIRKHIKLKSQSKDLIAQ